MPIVESLDELIAVKATEFANQIKAAAVMANKEEEIRIEVEKQLAFIQREVGIKLEGKHEFTVASGRIDSVYDRVIIEYKNPKAPGALIGPSLESPGSKKVVEQIKKRFYDMRHEHGQPLNSLFGVGLDGNHFIFIRFRDEKWQVQEPVEVNRHSAERFLWALFNLGTSGKPFSPEYLAGDFGSEGGNTIAISGIHALYNAIVTTDNPKAQTFFSQWKILFGEVCGYDIDSPSNKIKKLAEFYQVGIREPKPAELLFAVHTYYALFMKLLASQIVAFFHKLPTPLEKMMQATTSNKLKREMEDLEAGSIFRHLNITNFLEGDLFAWYTDVWTEPIEKLVRDMVTKLDDYNPGTLSEDPTGSRDLLKKLYQQLFPKSVRHDLGEYYTPDWLAEHVLNELGYIGDPDKRLLDPACGSGTFLVMAINRIRQWYDENRERCRLDESELGRKILANVIGFDLNPLAVMAARTNYLIAIRDLVGHMGKVEIPVYLCDSIMTPSEYGGLFAGGLGKARQLKTAPTTFLIPTEIATNREDVAKYAEQLEFCVRNSYSPEEFIQRCRDEGLKINEIQLHSGLYNELIMLDKANKNGVWARIIKNAFAPIFTEKVDYIVGNPPWITWESLPREYRNSTTPLWIEYNLFRQKGMRARLAAANDDLSILLTYVALDRYLNDSGKLGFVITQSVFQGSGGEGFRQFQFKTKQLDVICVHDMVRLQPFESATNRTATITIQKGRKTIYPVTYIEWSKRRAISISQDDSLNEVLEKTMRRERQASPVNSQNLSSSWQVQEKGASTNNSKLAGRSSYRARKGVCTSANGIYWLNQTNPSSSRHMLFSNDPSLGRRKIERINDIKSEKDLLFPLIRGRDVKKWVATPSKYILFPHQPETAPKAINLSEMKRRYPQAYSYLLKFREELEERVEYRKFLAPGGEPFYALYAVGPYTFSPYKVVFREIASGMIACAISDVSDPLLGTKMLIPDHKLVLIPCQSEAESHYLAALMNSTPFNHFVMSYTIGTQISTHILEHIKIPVFDAGNPLHRTLSEVSLKCHHAASTNNIEITRNLQTEIDQLAAKIWGLTSGELQAYNLQTGVEDRPKI